MATTLRGCRILVVEDSFLLAETLREYLDESGYVTVGPAAQVSAALVLCGSNHLDGALLDINLGKETCFPVADRLTEEQVPFMFLSGYDNYIVPDRFRDVPKLDKPYDRAEILRTAERLFLNGRAGR
jgi:CheY-like chemotaxis protein